MRTTGLKGCSPKIRSGSPDASPRAATESEEVVVARCAAGHAPASVAEQLGLGLGVLGDRLDDQVALREVRGIGRHLDSPRVAPIDLGAERRAPAPRRARQTRPSAPAAASSRGRLRRRPAHRRWCRCRLSPAARMRPQRSFQISRSDMAQWMRTPSGSHGSSVVITPPRSRAPPRLAWGQAPPPSHPPPPQPALALHLVSSSNRRRELQRRPVDGQNNGKFRGREVVIVEAARTPVGRGHEEKGYYKDTHASNLLAKAYSEVIDRAGVERLRGRGRRRWLRPAVRRAGHQHRPQRLARGGSADRDPRDDRRPPVRLGPAGRQLRRGDDRLGRPRRDDRRRRRAHGPHLLRRLRRGDEGARPGVLAPS